MPTICASVNRDLRMLGDSLRPSLAAVLALFAGILSGSQVRSTNGSFQIRFRHSKGQFSRSPSRFVGTCHRTNHSSIGTWFMPNEQRRLAHVEVLKTIDINSPVGGRIENYRDAFPITNDVVPALERFLSSTRVDNRNSALAALVIYGQRDGYEADAVLLHYQSRDYAGGSPEEFASIHYLRIMQERGSATAFRLLDLLDADPYVRSLWPELENGEPQKYPNSGAGRVREDEPS